MIMIYKNFKTKDKCLDIFRDFSSPDRNTEIFEQKNHKKFSEYKINIIKNKLILSKITTFLSLKLLSGSLYLKTMIERIEIAKRVFITEIEKGVKTLISIDLS
jgi:hypothetical protein